MEATNATEHYDDDNNINESDISLLRDDREHCKRYGTSECYDRPSNNNSKSANDQTINENSGEKKVSDENLARKTAEKPSDDRSARRPADAREKSNNDEESPGASDSPLKTSPVQNSPAPLAFTIDFGNNKEVDTTRYQNLFQRYNARHRRNLSTSKIEIKEKKPAVAAPANFVQKNAASAHSEGYFSSEDDTKRKADKLSQKLKKLDLATSKSRGTTRKVDAMSRSYTEKSNESRNGEPNDDDDNRENLSLQLDYRPRPGFANYNSMTHSATMNDLSGVLRGGFDDDDDEVGRENRAQYSPEKTYTKNIEYDEINDEYASVERHEGASRSDRFEKLSNVDRTMDHRKTNEFSYSETNEAKMQTSSVSFTAEGNIDDPERMNLDIFNVSNADACSDGTVSEAGTYTIHKDYTDEEKARMDIDGAFSVGVITERESGESYVHHFKMTNSRDTNTWISEWATQVAEHNSLPPPVGGSTGRTPPLTPSKIPSPVYSRAQRSRTRYEQSDSSLDMEIHLHIKERHGGTLSNQHAGLIDSGGESDEDTSNSYVTPPLSAQRTPTHGASLVRRGSLTETLFKRSNPNECRRSMRNCVDKKIHKNDEGTMKSPSRVLACLHLQRSSSLDRKEYTSDTAESNSSRKSSLKNYADVSFKHTNSPIMNRLRPSTPKLTNSPILSHKEVSTRVIEAPLSDKTKNVHKAVAQTQNVGYFTCTESSPYLLRKSNSTSNYHEETSLNRRKELTPNASGVYQSSPVFRRNDSIQRSSSNTSIKNTKFKGVLTRRGSFNNNDNDRLPKEKFSAAASDSSSEAGGEQQTCKPPPPISSGIKLNRAFSIRRARLSCESDTTPNTTPEERRKKAQIEIKSAPSSARQANHYRTRTSSVGASNRETFKKPEIPKPRAPSISRTDTGRISIRGPKTSHAAPASRPNQKSSKDHKKSGRSNSTLTSKEVEFQNWKRRKSYDPMKAAAEGKKKIDGPKKQHSVEDGSSSRDNSVLRSASFHGTRGTLSLADDWSDNEIEFAQRGVQAPPPCSPQLGSDSDLETASYLQTTQNVMTAMSARINVYDAALVDSGGESDEDTSHSFRQGANKLTREISDTETSDEPQAVAQSPMTNAKYNRTFNLRRGRLEPQEAKVSCTSAQKPKNLGVASVKARTETAPSIARTDSGRFSMRLPKATANTLKSKPKDAKKQLASNARELEMQNWKRRKSYDPMKAAMEGKRKAGLAKRSVNDNSFSSHVSRSQSFHGPATLGISEWSDEDVSASADEAPIY